MANSTVGKRGEIELPADLRKRYGIETNAAVRLVETKGGILVMPLHEGPISPELAAELAEWQALSEGTLEVFPYDEDGA